MDLRGKTAVITGASRGLGAGLARDFAARGMKLALCARSECALPDGADGITRRVDVADEAGVREFAARAAEALGVIDLWINNAAVLTPIDRFRDISSADFVAHMAINVMGVVHGSRAYLDHLEGADARGVLINISSGAARHGYAGWAPYCAGKAAVDRISETIQLEEGDRVTVYALAPGIVDTDMQALVRATPRDRFPMVDKFLRIKEHGAFNSIPYVAEHILRHAFDPEVTADEVHVRIPPEVEMPA